MLRLTWNFDSTQELEINAQSVKSLGEKLFPNMPLQGSHIPHEKLSNAGERQDLNIYKVGWRCKSFEMGYYIEIQPRYS
jgi:hypothetical protein